MPRQSRPDVADVPQHVVQRGNDRQPCFYVADDYRRYLAGLCESAIRYGCVVHAYVLMTNHVHLLVTPSRVGAVSRMMQWLGRQYVGYINVHYRCTKERGQVEVARVLVPGFDATQRAHCCVRTGWITLFNSRSDSHRTRK